VNERHCQRVAGLFKDEKDVDIVVGGEVSVPERYIAPTILTYSTIHTIPSLLGTITTMLCAMVWYGTINWVIDVDQMPRL
jgi:hypothetical protein